MVSLPNTNAVTDLMRGHPRLTGRASQLSPPDRAIIVPIVRGEILYAMERMPIGRRRQQLRTTAQTTLPALPCEPMVAAMADGFDRIKSEAEAKGAAISDHDLWIAAAAEFLRSSRVTPTFPASREFA
jgi:predicted nucleic acid-binding protein